MECDICAAGVCGCWGRSGTGVIVDDDDCGTTECWDCGGWSPVIPAHCCGCGGTDRCTCPTTV